MNHAQDQKHVAINSDMTVDNAAFTTAAIDTLGYDYAQIAVHFGNVPANVAALKVQECDTSGGTYADISGTVVGTDTDIDDAATTLPTAAAGDGALIVFELDLRNRKRFLDVVCTAGNGSGTVTEMSAVCTLSRAKKMPVTSSERGATSVLRV